MASGFESERSLAARKEERRRQREALLQQAKANYEKEERRKELKRLRGEDTWMLSDVTARVEELEKEHSVAKKKKKEKRSKKPKKEKKRKKHKDEKNDSSDSPSDSAEEWVEASVSGSSSTEKSCIVNKEQPDTAEGPTTVQRDEWMSLNFITMKTLSSASLKAEKQKEKLLEQQKTQASEQSLLSERELNPYWKDGGTGLPSQEDNLIKAAAVEDGGLGWLKKSYQRMKEQSERENRDLEELVAERYGSMELFESRLKEAERAAVQKENERRKWPKSNYSEKESHMRPRRDKEKQQQQERDEYKGKPKDRDSEDYFQETRNCTRNRLKEDKEPSHSSKGSAGKDFSPRTAQYSHQRSCEKSFPSPLKPAFWKPAEDGGQGRQSFSSSKLHTPGFRKPGYDTEDGPVSRVFRKPDYGAENTPRWRRTQPKEVEGKAALDEKSVTTEMATLAEKPCKTETAVSSRENDPREKKEETIEDALENDEPSHSKSSYSGSVTEDESPRILSEEEMNRLGAKIVKAELIGNTGLAAQLQAQLDNARKLKESKAQISARKPEEETASAPEDHDVVLVRTDKSGRSWPVNAEGEPMEPKGGRRKRQTITTHMDKERVRYFQDDDNLSLKDLVRNEKMRTAEDQNKLFMRMASKFSDKTDRDYYTLDDMFVSNAAKGERSGEVEERQRRQAIQEHRQLAACMENCPHCFGSPRLPKHLIVAIGSKVYLSLPNYQSLTEGHCVIVPMQHITAATLLDEDIWEEIQAFRKALVKMFETEGLDCVFLETNLSTKKRYHMVYECIPLPREVGDMAPIYFKKAIMECDEEWAMNKKLIDLSSKDVRKCAKVGKKLTEVDSTPWPAPGTPLATPAQIFAPAGLGMSSGFRVRCCRATWHLTTRVPKGLPYFSVDFGLQAGFAHVIEDQHRFPVYFGKEIIGGMLDLEPRLWRKGLRENFEDQRKKVLHFAQKWKPYDFTRSKD
ncbi:CWF19-like protein 2 isoform X2 [Sphaerodactylus townsendi]|uniref:CWF19-like protein 2 isoform X2 n=1 Tax=Sphaerodactylus townsendi TaxID=933632 RepID=UPI0020260B03|nr:CWF19-like protein 2 isoform X2 [Sphaerodactylus townsendi]